MITTDPAQAIAVLASGRLCAIPTETVYGLAAAATIPDAVASVFEAKGRPSNHPLIVHIASIDYLDAWINDLPLWAKQLAAKIWPGPLTLVGHRTQLATDAVTGGQDTVAVRIPHHPLTLKVLSELAIHDVPGVVAPSANRFGHVSPTSAQHVAADLGEYLVANNGLILDGGPSQVGVESTIVLAISDTPAILRPGGITRKDITEITGLSISEVTSAAPKVSGSLDSHYAPHAQVILVSEIELEQILVSNPESDVSTGLIAFAEIQTPSNIIRLASPASTQEYAQQLYQALRKADKLELDRVFVVAPTDNDIAEAIRDRLRRAAHS